MPLTWHVNRRPLFGDGPPGDECPRRPAVDSRRRIRLCLLGFVVALLIVFSRAVQLEVTQGEAFRSQAAEPLVRRHSLPGVRGRILARDGTVLACDKKTLALAVHYRWLEEPANPRWLRWTARSRLSRAERRDAQRVAAEEARVEAERAELAQRLASLSGLSRDEWARRARRVQTRVERIAESVNQRHLARSARQGGTSKAPPSARPSDAGKTDSLLTRLCAATVEILRASIDEPPQRITVAEELDYHVMAEDVPLALVAETEANPDRYPCVKIVLRSRRLYPAGPLAAHVLGHLGPVAKGEMSGPDGQPLYHPEDRVGRTGLERQCEHLLRGRRGIAVELTDRSGRVLSSSRRREPEVGRDLVLTLDPQLQRAAESLLDGALARRTILDPEAEPGGGAVVAIDVHTGEVLAAASAPRFDPNVFSGSGGSGAEDLLADPAGPLFDRVAKMALPPGSVFKPVTAVALLEAAGVDPNEKVLCRGYLHQPDRWRCAIYARHSVGHGEMTLADALAESCNVYFFRHADRFGPDPLTTWALRFGFGTPTGVDLPGEASGTLPTPGTIRQIEDHAWRSGDTRLLSIGQGSFQATPLQVVRMMAAIANGGRLVAPHVVSRLGLPELADSRSAAELSDPAGDPIRIDPPRPIRGLRASTLAEIRRGLERVVADPRGTGHGTVHLESIAIAGKTGTAETGPGRAEHAWFAGYAPADKPKVAFVVVLEHAGDAAQAAGPVAKRLVRRMHELGYFRPARPPRALAESTLRKTGMK
jgi:penicillin-binding protein 2